MKKNIWFIVSAIVLCVFVVILIANSSDSPEKISSRQIVKSYNQFLDDNALSQKFTTIDIGYYETTFEERCNLKKMEAVGLITVEFERFAWWEKILVEKQIPQTYTTWWGHSYTNYITKKIEDYHFEDHIMAKVSLTKAGEKLIVSELPEVVEKEDKDMVQPEFDPEKYPECSVDCAENWPNIKNPFVKEEPQEEEIVEETVQDQEPVKDNKKEEVVELEDENEVIERKEASQYEAYKNALANVNRTECLLKGCTVKAKKARNIQIINENGVSTAVAEVILEKNNVSDAYRVANQTIDGEKTSRTVIHTYYLDKGWVLVENPLVDYVEEFIDKWEKACSIVSEEFEELERQMDELEGELDD